MSTQSDIDSKFRFVIVASKRAKQLLKGSKPKLKSKSKNLIQIAQEEVTRGMVDYEIVDSHSEEIHVSDEDMFIGEELGIDVEDVSDEIEEVEEKVVEAKVEEKAKESIQDTVKKKVRIKVSEKQS